MSTDTGVLEEAYERLHATGPEFDGGLSNHGPMAVEAMARRGHAREVHGWIDWYQGRLEEHPRGLTPVTREDWREALGDRNRYADWCTFMQRESQERPWRELLVEWWPRLLPGIIAGATHGVIRVGHSVHALLEEEAAGLAGSGSGSGAGPGSGPGSGSGSGSGSGDEAGGMAVAATVTTGMAASTAITDGPRLAEFAHALAMWAMRWTPLDADASRRSGLIAPSEALAAVPRVAEQNKSVSKRIGQLGDTPGWAAAIDALRTPETPRQAAELLAEVANAAVLDYLTHGQANPVMLVHASTAPTAVLRTLPALPESLWVPSLDAAWLATAAITAAYRNTEAEPEQVAAAIAETEDPQEAFARAVRHRDEHAVKFADTAIEVYERTGDARTLAAATRATMMIKAPQ